MKTLLLFLPVLLASFLNSSAAASGPVVRSVMFYSPACQYCTEVKQREFPKWFGGKMSDVKTFYTSDPSSLVNTLIPFELRKSAKFELLMVNILTPQGDSVWQAVCNFYNVPQKKRKIPMLLAETKLIVGSSLIAKEFPPLLKKGYAAGGVDWPENADIKNLLVKIAAFDNGAGFALQPPPKQDFLFYLEKSPALALLSFSTLLWLLFQTALATRAITFGKFRPRPPKRQMMLLILAATGIFISGYLSWAHLTNSDLACGPLSECDIVNQSRYGKLFGVLPVAYIGFAGYLLLALMTWFSVEKKRDDLWIWLQRLSFVAVIISTALISIAIFPIQATCLWCVGSALTAAEIQRRLRG